ncbi:MAG: S8 family serine peptidase [Acidobacteriota bacterium]
MSRSRLGRSVSLVSLVIVLALGVMWALALTGDSARPAYVPGEVLLKFRPDAPLGGIARLRGELAASTLNTFASRAEQWRLGPGVNVEAAIARLQASPLVEYAEPNFVIGLDVIPNDPRVSELWGMNNTGQTGGTVDADIDADLAWGVSTGSPSVVVGVIDTGIDYNHPDLAPNIWTNPGEVAGNGIDDDNNGFIDDVHGYDFINNDPDPFDDNGHGSHVSGTITAAGNNSIGVAGVAWNVKVMGLKFLSGGGSGNTADAVRAVDYATMMHVDLTSNSWGGGGFSQTLYDAIARAGAANIAFVAAAGNDGVNNDTSPHYPSSYDLANLISVAATDHRDLKASFSNWGPTSVDLAAPGVDILSTLPGNTYGTLSGTSMATPHVSGVCALIRSVSPNIPVAQMKNVLLNSVDHIASMNGQVVSNGRLNAFFAIAEPDNVAPGMINSLAAVDPGSNTMGLSWTATGDDGNVGTANYYELRYSLDPITEANFSSATRAGKEPAPLVAGTTQQMEVKNLQAASLYFFAIRAVDEWGNAGPISNVAEERTLPSPTAQAAPTSISDTLLTGQQSDHVVTLTNIGEGTLDFTIPPPAVGEPTVQSDSLELGKDEIDPRVNHPQIESSGGPDSFGYRWVDSDQPGGPAFSWLDISTTGTALNLTGDDATTAPLDLGFNAPFYGTFFNQVRVCSNGWVSFTSAATSYSNQPLPSASAPENLIAALWDDLNPKSVNRTYFQSFGNKAVVQWQAIPRYSGTGDYTFQMIIEASGAITLQYLTLTGDLTSATVGIQDASKSAGLQVAFNQAYLHDNLAIRINSTPQWLTASPTAGRLRAGESLPINVHIDASGLEGGEYPGTVNIQTNDPAQLVIPIAVALHVTGAPDITVQPQAIDYGERFVNNTHPANLIVANDGTDVLHVTNIVSSDAQLVAAPTSFDVAPHGSQNVAVNWTPTTLGPFSGSLTIQSNDGADPNLAVPVTGTAVAAPQMTFDPSSFNETLFSGQTVSRPLHVTNNGGANLIVNAAADQGNGGNGIVSTPDEGTEGSGGPDAFGYRWKDSDASGGPAYDFVDISSTGTTISFTSQDDALSSAISMGMTFPFYGSNFSSLKVCTNGWLTFDTTDTLSRLSNSTLPSSSGAKNMIAMFWDDLHLRSGNVKYRAEGSRFIVQYTNVEKFSPSGSPITFQVQLYSSGRVVLQYRTMIGTLNSATIGIQDSTRTIGLVSNFNANYVHSSMAIQYSRVPEWLRVTPASSTIPPGQSFDFTVTFDSNSRNGGDLAGAVVLNTNIPSQPQERVPAVLHVVGAPIVAIAPTSYAYGTRFTGYSYLTTFQVLNNGTDVLNVADVFSSDPNLFVEQPADGPEQPQASFPLQPGGARIFNLRWAPTVAGPLNALVHVISDDPTTPDKTMPVTGLGIVPPVAVNSPDSFAESLDSGQVVHRTLHLENQGGSDLNFTTRVQLNSGASVTVYEPLELKKDEPDPRPGVLGTGGPDVFGYTWKDSDDAEGPAFDWVDISSTGTAISFTSSDDALSSAINLGITFPFYGGSFSSLKVGTNGWLTFDTTDTSTRLSNSALPNSSGAANMLALFWDDLHLRNGNVRYLADGTRFIVQYTHVDRFSSTTPSDLTFQVILYPNGRIVMQYLTMTSAELASATVGMQDQAKTDGLTVVFNSAYMHNNLAIEYAPPFLFPTLTPNAGTVAAGSFVDIDVAIDARGLVGGDYQSSIEMSTNDPARGLISIPVNVHVTGIPDIDVTPLSLSFPTTFVGFSSTLPMTIRNIGTDAIHVTALNFAGEFNSTTTAPFDLAPGAATNVNVNFTPLDEGTRLGSLTVVSNDPDEGSVVVALQGEALIPPEIHVTPPAISTALPPGGHRTKQLTIRNEGGSNLYWDGGTNLISTEGTVSPGSYVELAKDDLDTRAGILGAGGPDLFGYSWTDSDQTGGPTFDWVDISSIGTQITGLTGDDQNAQAIPIGFSFPFYGNNFSTVNVCTNGWLSFSSTLTTFTNQPLPNNASAVPENLLAPFWDDLHFRTTGKAYYYNDGARLIVQYQTVERYAAGSLLTFQVQLYPNGRIVYQYLSLSGTLNSATVGIQNSAKDDGLNVVYNLDYLHDNLAIEFKKIPDWIKLGTTGGTVPESGAQNSDVLLDAVGLEDGIHEAVIKINSNDPYTPLVEVPVRLNVSLVAPTLTDFVPKIIRHDGSVLRVRMTIQLTPDLNPHNIRLGSVMLNDSVPALADPPPYYTDSNRDGIEEVTFWFDSELFFDTVAEGQLIPVTIQGEVEDVQWWRGTDYVRTGDPAQYRPLPGSYNLAGSTLNIAWNPASQAPDHRYTIQLSRDGGANWETLATNVTGLSYDWTVSGTPTESALVKVLSYDGRGSLLGQDTTDAPFTIAGAALNRPNPIDGSQLLTTWNGSSLRLEWKAPATDLNHGPADRFRIMRGTDPQNLSQVALVSTFVYTEDAAATSGGAIYYYRVIAANAAGDAP